MAEICVLGLGYVGLPTASLLANAGFQVLGVDVDADIVERLNSGKTRMEEAGLGTLVSAAVRSGNLVAAGRPEVSDTFIICVPTPIGSDKKVDLSAVRNAARSIAACVRKGCLVILESTSPVGTTRNVVGSILKESELEPGQDFDLCYCPERVLPGNTVAELVNNDRIVGGVTPESARRAEALYARFCQGKISLTDDLTAELCKLMENTYRDVNVALANVFARIAEDAGVDAWQAIELANLHPRVKILKPGPGVGGHCIPVDPWFLSEAFPQHAGLLKCAREVNDSQARRLLERMMATGKLRAGGKLAILGAAYKADIDDPRESPAGLLAAAARKYGIETAVHDPIVKAGAYHGLMVSNDLSACLKEADAAALLTEHKQYRSLSSKIFAEAMRGRLIADARNWLNHATLRAAGFEVVVLGCGK
ncbi:MAG TPA: nucleotide sugar dehydrogenase [Planctomycetota bacterium]|nr:nucleotide sugar dehydrogenase [Planctomycetota bacterium]